LLTSGSAVVSAKSEGAGAVCAGEGAGEVEACRIEVMAGIASGVYLLHCCDRSNVLVAFVRRGGIREVIRGTEESYMGRSSAEERVRCWRSIHFDTALGTNGAHGLLPGADLYWASSLHVMDD